jgi:hypothetical protein
VRLRMLTMHLSSSWALATDGQAVHAKRATTQDAAMRCQVSSGPSWLTDRLRFCEKAVLMASHFRGVSSAAILGAIELARSQSQQFPVS